MRPLVPTIQFGLNWWHKWRDSSVNKRIFAAMLTVGGLTLVVKVAAAAKELVVAYQFGTSDALDAFLMASLLPQFVVELIGGALNAALIPTYVQVREQEGREAAQRLLSSIMMSSIVLVMAASVLLMLLAAYVLPLLASGFSPDKLALTRRLYLLLLPMLLFCGLATVWNAVLNAGERVALGAVMPMVTSLLTVLLLLGVGERYGIRVLAVATVVGMAVEALLLGWGLSRQGVSIVPRWCGVSPAVRQVFRQYAPAVAASFLMGSTGLIAQSMAAMLGPGSVSALAYGSKATFLFCGIGAVAVSTSVLPHFSRMVAVGDVTGVRHTLKTYARLILVVTIPLTGLLIYFSEPLIKLFLQRGAFTEGDTHIVAQVQAVYLLQVPLFVLSILLVRLISSLKANHLLLWGTVVNVILIIIFSHMFMRWFQVVGIALAISLMYLISTGYLIYAAMRLTRDQAGTLCDTRTGETPVLNGIAQAEPVVKQYSASE
ncbi:MAG: lipid II flippase MurJ [Nitrospira sp.]